MRIYHIAIDTYKMPAWSGCLRLVRWLWQLGLAVGCDSLGFLSSFVPCAAWCWSFIIIIMIIIIITVVICHQSHQSPIYANHQSCHRSWCDDCDSPPAYICMHVFVVAVLIYWFNCGANKLSIVVPQLACLRYILNNQMSDGHQCGRLGSGQKKPGTNGEMHCGAKVQQRTDTEKEEGGHSVWFGGFRFLVLWYALCLLLLGLRVDALTAFFLCDFGFWGCFFFVVAILVAMVSAWVARWSLLSLSSCRWHACVYFSFPFLFFSPSVQLSNSTPSSCAWLTGCKLVCTHQHTNHCNATTRRSSSQCIRGSLSRCSINI